MARAQFARRRPPPGTTGMADKRCYYCGKHFRRTDSIGFVAGLSNNHGPPTDEEILSCSDGGLLGPDEQAPHHALQPNQIKAHKKCCDFMRNVNLRGSQQRRRRSSGLDERPPVLPPKERSVKSAAEKARELQAEGEAFRSQIESVKKEEQPGAGGSVVTDGAAEHEPTTVDEPLTAAGEPMVVVKGKRKGAVDPSRRLDSYLSKPKVLLRVARQRAKERNEAIAALERKTEQHDSARKRAHSKSNEIKQLRKERDRALGELKKASARLDVFDEAAQVLGQAELNDMPTLLAEAVVSGHVDANSIFARFLDDQLCNVFHATSFTHRFKGSQSNPNPRALPSPLTTVPTLSSFLSSVEQWT